MESSEHQEDANVTTSSPLMQMSEWRHINATEQYISINGLVRDFFAWKECFHKLALEKENLREQLLVTRSAEQSLLDHKKSLMEERSILCSIVTTQQSDLSKLLALEQSSIDLSEEFKSTSLQLKRIRELYKKELDDFSEKLHKCEEQHKRNVESLKTEFAEELRKAEARFQEKLSKKEEEMHKMNEDTSRQLKNKTDELLNVKLQCDEKTRKLKEQLAKISTANKMGKHSLASNSWMKEICSNKIKQLRLEYEKTIEALEEKIRLLERTEMAPRMRSKETVTNVAIAEPAKKTDRPISGKVTPRFEIPETPLKTTKKSYRHFPGKRVRFSFDAPESV